MKLKSNTEYVFYSPWADILYIVKKGILFPWIEKEVLECQLYGDKIYQVDPYEDILLGKLND